jgi:hypothetical protein
MANALVSDDDVIRFTAVAALTCGQMILVSDGRVGVVQNVKPVAIGDTATVKVKGIVSATAAATMVAGDQVGVHIANQTVIAAGGTGSTPAGTLMYGVTSGGTAQFDLNKFSDRNTSIGASTAAAGSATGDAGVLPAGTAAVYPTTAADGTKGVRISASDEVTGRKLYIANGVSNAILKVYPPTGGTINGAAANAAFSSASGKGVVAVCVDAATRVWAAF